LQLVNAMETIANGLMTEGMETIYTVEGVGVLADYLYDLYSVTGNIQYRDVADKMVNWVESMGIKVSSNSLKFPSWDGKFRSIVWGDWDRILSIRTPGEIFIKSYKATGNNSRLAVAEMFANWLASISVETSRTSMGSYTRISRAIPYIEGEESYSPWVNAILFDFLVNLYSIDRDQKYLDLATSLLNYIEDYMEEKTTGAKPYLLSRCEWNRLSPSISFTSSKNYADRVNYNCRRYCTL